MMKTFAPLKSRLCPTALLCLLFAATPARAQTAGHEKSQDPPPPEGAAAPADSGSAAEMPKGLVPIPNYADEIGKRSHLTGDWNGNRTDLANKGLQLQLNWVQVAQGVTSGGADADNGYTGNLDYLMYLDLHRMGLMPGAVLKIRGETRYGESINGKTGQLLPANTPGSFPLTNDPDEVVPFTLTNVLYSQFLSEKFGVFVGKLDTFDGDQNAFASGRGDTQFLNTNFVLNTVGALMVPYSTLGAGFLWNPTNQVLVTGGIMNTADSSTTTGFDKIGDGWTASLELNFHYRLGGLPGGMNVGGIYAWNNDFLEFGRLIFEPGQGLSTSTSDSTWAAYWSGWQYLFVEEPTDEPINIAHGVPHLQGVGLFSRAGVGDDDTNPISWNISGGIGGRGVIPGRDNDTFGVGYFYLSLQPERLLSSSPIRDSSQGFEAFYNIAITPAAKLTLDAQVLEPPNSDLDTAVVLGLRLDLTF